MTDAVKLLLRHYTSVSKKKEGGTVMQSLSRFKVNPLISALSLFASPSASPPPLHPRWRGGRGVRLTGISLLLLLFAVACGAAATATPAPAKVPQPAAAQPPAPAAPAAAAAPTAAPKPTTVPVAAAPAVSPGKVTWMVGSLANERMTYTLAAGGGHDYGRQLHAFLIGSDVKDGQRVIIPGVATDWGVSSDGLTWTVTVRKGVKFHNGAELTTEDVLWTLRFAMGPQAKEYATGGASLNIAPLVDKVEQAGPDKVSVTMKIPTSDFPFFISEGDGSWIGTIYPKQEKVYDEKALLDYDKNPVGAGIMKLVKHVHASVMQFERFDDHYYQPKNGFPQDRRVKFRSFDLRLVPEEATRIAALRAGEADIAPISLSGKKQVEAGGGRVLFGPEGVYFYARQQGCWKPQFPCNKKEVRQALGYAIDKKVMQNQLYGGPDVMQVKGWPSVTPSTVGYSPELDPFPFDPVKARQLLADAGYPGGKGFGKLIINTWVSSALPLMPESAQLAADFWKRELGLDVEVKVGDEAALKKATRLTEDHHGQILWRDNETRVDSAAILRSGYGTADRKDGAHNDPELFDLTRKGLAVFDPVERGKALNSTYRRMRDEAYDINLGYINIPFGVGPRVLTWQPYPLAFYASALHTITLK
jgi:peptide/nickel transport system substrate-binding protein